MNKFWLLIICTFLTTAMSIALLPAIPGAVVSAAAESPVGVPEESIIEQEWTEAQAFDPLPPPEFNLPQGGALAVDDIPVDRSRRLEEIVEMAKVLPHSGFNSRKITRYNEPPLFTAPYGAGSLDAEDLDDALNALKMVRYLAGLPYDINISGAYNNSAQHKAVLMAVSEYSHYPVKPGDMSEEFYQAASMPIPGSESIYAGVSNLSDSILGFVADPGENNIATAGHRMMMLRPATQSFGMGYACNQNNPISGGYRIAVHSGYQTTLADTYVAWPNSGDFPIQYFTWSTNIPTAAPVYPWSLSLGSEYQTPDINNVVLTLTRARDNKSWTFDSTTPNLGYGGYNNPALDHLAINGRNITFRPNANELGSIRDGDAFNVRLTGVRSYTGAETVLEYSINFFDLAKEMDRSSLRIFVYEDFGDTPVQGATVIVDGQTLATGADGSVTLRVDNDSTYAYTVGKDGYATKTGAVSVGTSGATVNVLTYKTINTPYNGFLAPPDTDEIPAGAIHIKTAEQLSAIGGPSGAGKYYVLDNDIVLENEWTPIDDFQGTLDGCGFCVLNLYVPDTSRRDYAGLFGNISASYVTVKNLGVIIGSQGVTAAATRDSFAGGLIGSCYNVSVDKTSSLTISNCYVTGNVTSNSVMPAYYSAAGGLIGEFWVSGTATISNCYTTGDVYIDRNIGMIDDFNYIAGGLIGVLDGQGLATITNCFALGDVYSYGNIAGGLIGACYRFNYSGAAKITDCYASGNVTAIMDTSSAGGLIGDFDYGALSISRSSATGDITSLRGGGLIGSSGGVLTVTDSYAAGNITDYSLSGGNSSVYGGGLIGVISNTATINNSYAAGNITLYNAATFAGGLIGFVSGGDVGVNNCYRLSEQTVAAQTIYAGGTPLSAIEMQNQASFAGWNFVNIWEYGDGYPYPRLRDYAPPAIVLGDVSGDGIINMQDVLTIYQYFRGKISMNSDELQSADVNRDGAVNMQDVLLVYQYFRGKILTL